MLLEDLKQHARAQTDGINALLDDPNDTTFYSSWHNSDRWLAFKNSLWNKGLPWSFQKEEPVERDNNPVEDFRILPDTLPDTRQVADVPDILLCTLGLDAASPRIFVRPEYEEAEKGALSAAEEFVTNFVVTGGPGIGKTMFLLWLLMRRLALGLPTVLQLNKTPPLLFHERGVSRFARHKEALDSGGFTFQSSTKIWALFDSNDHVKRPAMVLRNDTFFVVEAVSFFMERLEWMNGSNTRHFFMETWSFSEVLQARPYLGLDGTTHTERQLWHLYHEYGASARSLTYCAHDPSFYETRAAAHVGGLSLNPSILEDTLPFPPLIKFCYLAVLVEPSPTSRSVPEKRVASPRLAEMLQDKLRHKLPKTGFSDNVDNTVRRPSITSIRPRRGGAEILTTSLDRGHRESQLLPPSYVRW